MKPNLDLKDIYDRLFLVILSVDVVLRMLWLDRPYGSMKFTDGVTRETSSLIFDEWYYVNVARIILGLPQSVGGNGLPPYVNATPGLDPNHEHPPLAKLLIALSMYFLGDSSGYAWRLPSVIFGSLAILVFYLLMKRITNHRMVPLVATFLLSFDNLVFVHSRIATLDIFGLSFMLLGCYWYFSGRNYLSAIAMALSTLAKITGAAGFFAIAVIHAAKFAASQPKPRPWDQFFSWFEKYIGVFAATFLILLAVFDRLWVGYSNPFTHMQFILNYSTALTSSCPNGIISCPWQWLINQVQIPYLTVSVSSGSTRYDSIAFLGAINPAILYLTIPVMAYSAYQYFKRKEDLTLFAFVWFAVTYLSYYPLVIVGHRVTYLFYFLSTIPALCGGIAYMIADQNPPKLVVIFYLAVVAVSFYLMFPFKIVPS